MIYGPFSVVFRNRCEFSSGMHPRPCMHKMGGTWRWTRERSNIFYAQMHTVHKTKICLTHIILYLFHFIVHTFFIIRIVLEENADRVTYFCTSVYFCAGTSKFGSTVVSI